MSEQAIFAKVFNDTPFGQVLVKIDHNDEQIPEVRFYVQPPNLGVCSVAISFTDDDEGWDRAEAAFAKVDEAFAVQQVKLVIDAWESAGDAA